MRKCLPLVVVVKVFVFVLGALTGCGASVAPDSRSSLQWSLTRGFHYPTMGMGGGNVSGSIMIPDGAEHRIASTALLMALQDNQLSVRRPDVPLDGVIPPNTRWATDVAPIPKALIERHNAAFPSANLRTAVYGVSFEGLHSTDQRRFQYRISAKLYARGAMAKSWSQVSDDGYSGKFFVDWIAGDIDRKLNDLSVRRP